jgi:branched-chain amino acid transport system permease protein
VAWYDILAQQLVNGLTIGMVYALIALGYTMVYGIIQLINFAHGEVFMVGAYIGLTVLLAVGCASTIHGWQLMFVLALVVSASMSFCGVLGVVIEKLAYRPLRQAPRLAPLITAIGVSFFLQNAVMLIYGATDKSFPAIFPQKTVYIGGATVSGMQILIMLVSLLLMFLLHAFVKYSRIGRAFRATSQDIKAASLMGVNVDRIISLCFLLGSSLGAAGGVMFGLYYNTINFHDGYIAGLKAFTAAVLGGIGNIPGAMLGGVVLGLVEGLGAGYISSAWKNVFAFGLLVLLLLVKPTGLLGHSPVEKT